MNSLARIGIIVAAITTLSGGTAFGQSITERYSKLNFGYLYGAGGDSHTDSVFVEDFVTLQDDTEAIGYTGSTGGVLPNDQPYTGGVGSDLHQQYGITGPLTAFESISASASVIVEATSTGAGVATMQATNPGNELRFNFMLATSVHYELTGHFNHPNPGVFQGVQLERFNGFNWEAVFSTFFTPNGPFNSSGILIPSLYRMHAFIGINVQGNESATTTFDYLLTIRRSADMNCDGLVNGRDIGPFVTALLNTPAYDAQFPDCDPINGDVNFDNVVTAADVAPFVNCVLAGGCQ